ncbi:hypothetical protein ACHAP6_003345 [Verticillium nonalfalfae]
MYGPCNFSDPFWTSKLPHVAAKLPKDLKKDFMNEIYDERPVPIVGGVSLEGQAQGPPDFSDPRPAFAMTQIASGNVLGAIYPSKDWKSVDPLLNVNQNFPPTYIAHGAADTMTANVKENDENSVIGVDKANVSHAEVSVLPAEQRMSPWECMRQNPKIVLLTLYANIGSAMVGYENLALSVCLAMPAFQMTFASEVNGTLIIPAYWQSAWNATYNVMSMLGSVVAGFLQDWFGRRSVFLAAIICSIAGTAINYVAETPAVFLGGKIVTGFAVGLVLAGTQTYVSEIAPLPMRGIALSANTIMLNLGLLMAISATFSRISIMDPSAFRIVFAAAWVFPGLLLLGLPFVPESPYWLVMKGKQQEARRALEKLSPAGSNVEAALVQIQCTIEAERALSAEKASLVDCFRGTNLRRTRIILICMYMPQIVGASLSANAPYFLNQTGLDSHTVVMLVQIGISLGVVSALVNVFFMMRLRHRPLIFAGVSFCVLMYLIMGIFGTMERSPRNLKIIGIALLITSISYGPAVGASMAVAGETSATRLRSKSMGLGAGFSAIYSVIWQVILPYLFNQDQANLGGNIGWIFFAMGAIYLAITYFDVPGTKGRTYAQLDTMFEKRVSARHFEKYQLDADEIVA